MRLNVVLNQHGVRCLVGLLEERRSRIFFEYSPEFLKTGLELSPFKLPLRPGVHEDVKRTFDGLFGVFNDSLPDGWGCVLLDRKLRRRGIAFDAISPLDRLALIGRDPMGALEYEPAEPGDDPSGDIGLDSLAGEVDRILAGQDSAVLDELCRLNGSSCGARPKIVAMVSDDHRRIIHGGGDAPAGFAPWIIKYPTSRDGSASGVMEYLYSLMAKNAGIEMPETFLFPSGRCPGYFGVRRFDRIGGQKIHTHTASGLLHASFRHSSLDYENLLKLTEALTRDIREVAKLVRLMIFNVKAGNRDDHSKNFSFLLNPDNQWRLAPAYDLTPSAGINGEQTAMVNGKGVGIGDHDLIAAAGGAGVSKAQAVRMIAEVDAALSELPRLKRNHGIR